MGTIDIRLNVQLLIYSQKGCTFCRMNSRPPFCFVLIIHNTYTDHSFDPQQRYSNDRS